MSEHTELVRVNKVNSFTYWNCRLPPVEEKFHQGDVSSSSTQPSKIFIIFAHFQLHHTQVEYKRKTTVRPKTCLARTDLNRCRNDKLCLMTALPIGRQRAGRNRTKFYACIKHLMLIFTSITVNKNNSYYNSSGQKT